MANKRSTLSDNSRGYENLVEYYIFHGISESSGNILNEIFVFLSSECHMSKYIWQCDALNLKTVSGTAQLPVHLYGSTYYGDNIEDEWYIVYLLLELSKKFEDVIIRIVDEDGEFILIEAADNLPSWLHPDTSENRVYIHKGMVHIVPHDQTDEMISVRVALSHIIHHPNETEASNPIQKDILRRIEGYPNKIDESKHATNCYIPANLLAVLDTHPFLISPIIGAFYERDDLDLKHCVTFKYFQPGTRVMRQVQMTRCLYAQLMQQKFDPDPRSGFCMPHINSLKYKAHHLGAKLAHGAEILCRRALSSHNSELSLDSTNAKWLKYHQSLVESGYFKNELEGSRLYNEMLSAAKCFYMTSIAPSLIEKSSGVVASGTTSKRSNMDGKAEINKAHSDSDGLQQEIYKNEKQLQDASLTSDLSNDNVRLGKNQVGMEHAGDVMLSLLNEITVDVEAMRREAKNLEDSDDDGWMDVGPVELEEMLARHSIGGKQDKSGNELGLVSKKVKLFVGQKSGHLGVELPESGDNEIFFEPDTFMTALQKVFDFEDPKSSSSDSELDEYASESDEQEMTSQKKDATLRDFMDLMDRELAGTEIGKSFVSEEIEDNSNTTKSPAKTSWATWENSNKKNSNICQTQQSDNSQKASRSNNGSIPEKSKSKNTSYGPKSQLKFSESNDDDDYSEDDNDFKPVDVDMNLVQNLLKSYSAQQGLAGPSSTVLNSLGLQLPPPEDEDIY